MSLNSYVAFGAACSKMVSLSTPFTTGSNTRLYSVALSGAQRELPRFSSCTKGFSLLGQPRAGQAENRDNVQQRLSKFLVCQAQFAAELWIFV